MSFDPPPQHWPPPGGPPGYPGQPGHGWGMAPPYPQPYPPARKPPPNKLWYVVSAALLAVGLVVVVGVGVGIIVHSFGDEPDAGHSFPAGGSTTLHIDAGQQKVVYVANARAAAAHQVHCDTTGDDGKAVSMSRYPGGLVLNRWEAMFTISPDRAGDYTVRCSGAPSDTFGVGDNPGLTPVLGAVLAALFGALLLIAGLSILTVALVLRRRRTR